MTDPKQDLREEALARFSRLTGAPDIARITQRGRDPQTARFTFHLKDGRQIHIGTIKNLWSQVELAKVLTVACGVVLARLKPADWQDLLAVLISACVEVQEIEGEQFEDTVREWLTDYTDTRALDADKNGAAAQGLPYRDNGHIHISASHFAKYVRREHSEQIALPELRQALGDIGFDRQTIWYQRAKKRAARSYYVGDAATVLPDEDNTS